MFKAFEIKEDQENKSHKNAVIRYDSSEIYENEINHLLEKVNSGELGDNTEWMKDNGVGELFELMGFDNFMKYLCSKNRSDLDSIIEKNSNKDAIVDLVDQNNWNPDVLKEDLKEEISQWVYNSSHAVSDYDIAEQLSNLLSEYDGTFWLVEASNLGWRKRSGHKFCKIEDGNDFIKKILPNTDCSFFITKNDDGSLSMVNYHHDAPTGESYTLTLMTPKVILDLYSDKNSTHDLKELLENSHDSDFKAEDKVKLFNQALTFDKSEDISTLIYFGHCPDDEVQAIEALVFGANNNASSALSQYIREASMFSNSDKTNELIDKALAQVKTSHAKNLLSELKE